MGTFLAVVDMSDCLFERNWGSTSLVVISSTITMARSHFIGNTGGGGVWSGGSIASPYGGSLVVESCRFVENYMPDSSDGGAVNLISGTTEFFNTTFLRNEATRYGGDVFVTSSAQVVFRGCLFVESTAYFGAALWAEKTTSVTSHSCIFERGSAAFASAFWFTDEVTGDFRNCSFSDGVVSADEGVGMLSLNSYATFLDSVFAGNRAAIFAGAMSILSSDALFRRCVFINNHALDTYAGVFNIATGARVQLIASTFESNHAETFGGIMYVAESAEVDIVKCLFSNNSAVDGASIYLLEGSPNVRVVASTFSNHKRHGSFIISSTARVPFAVTLDTVTFQSNELPALSSPDLVLIQNCEGLASNDVQNATVGACVDTGDYCLASSCSDDATVGTDCYCYVDGIATLFPPDCMESAVLKLTVPSSLRLTLMVEKPTNGSTELVLSNPGKRELRWEVDATSGLRTALPWSISPSSGIISAMDLAILTFTVQSEHVQSRADAFVVNITLRSDDSVCICRERSVTFVVDVIISASPSAEQSSVVVSDANTLLAAGTLFFEVVPVDIVGFLILDAPDTTYSASLVPRSTTGSLSEIPCSVVFYHGECNLPGTFAGDFELQVSSAAGTPIGNGGSINITTQCQRGQYRLNNGAPGIASCLECPDHATCHVRSSLADWILDSGYWRAGDKATQIIECPFETCLGGAVNNTDPCAQGSYGVLCGVCRVGFYNDGRTCSRCRSASAHIGTVAFGIIIMLALVGVSLCIAPRIEKLSGLRVIYIKRRLRECMLSFDVPMFKIVFAGYQIVSSVTWSIELSFPEPMMGFQRWISAITDLNIVQIMPVSCYSDSYSYHSKLVVMTVVPVCLVGGLAAVSVVAKQRGRSNVEWLSAAFMVLFVTLPATSTTVLRTFHCQVFEDGRAFLFADLSVNCASKTHEAYELFAWFNVLVYPVGCPMFYFYLLYRSKGKISPSRASSEFTALAIRSSDMSVAHLRPLFSMYSTGCWYWEVVDVYRRILMMGPLVFIEGKPTRAATGFLVSILFAAGYREAHPYASASLNALSTAANWQVVVVYAAGVVITGRPFGYSDWALGAILVVVCVAILFLVVALQLARGSSLTEVHHAIMEFEAREADLKLSHAEFIGVLDQHAQERYGNGDELTRRASKSLSSLAEQPSSVQVYRVDNGTTKKASYLRSRVGRVLGLPNKKDGFNDTFYPCYVVEHAMLWTFQKLPFHEHALADGLLEELAPNSRVPSPSHSYFISQASHF